MDQKTVQKIVAIAAATILLVAYVISLRNKQNQQPPNPNPPGGAADESVHLLMGNPSGATPDVAKPDDYLMRKPYFALSYNDSKGTPNWVSWCLRESDLGRAPRFDFYPDTELPKEFHNHIRPTDYSGSGFDRGHMCPHSDRANTDEASKATFVMTNMIPQAPAVNQKAWADFEDYCRTLTKKHQTLYIVSGPQGKGGTGTKGAAETIGKGKVTVPAKCWKVVLAVDGGTGTADDIGKVGANTRTIAIVMPNDESVGHSWAKYRTSVHEVEALTGYKFFDRVPAEVIDTLKAKVDDEHIAPAGRPKSGD